MTLIDSLTLAPPYALLLPYILCLGLAVAEISHGWLSS